MVLGSSLAAVFYTSDFVPASSKEFLDFLATIECVFTLKLVRHMMRTYSQIDRTDKYSEHSPILWSVWPIGWVFIYELSGSVFQSSGIHFNFRYRASFEQAIAWHWGKYRVWINSETPMLDDKNIQPNAPYRQILRTQLNHLVSLSKWLSFCLRTKCFWVWVQLRPLKLQIWRLIWGRSSLTFRQLLSIDSLWNAYVTW